MPPRLAFRGRRDAPSRQVIRGPWYAVEDDGKPAMMMCGRHLRPRDVPADVPHGYGAISKDSKMYYCRRLRAGERHGDCICDFHSFETLLIEKQGPHQFVCFGEYHVRVRFADVPLQTKQPFRFMDLPSELRLRVYEQLLVLDGSFELAPEPFYLDRSIDRYDAGSQLATEYRKAVDFHESRFRNELAPNMRLLRVSKEVNKEATAVFLGSNEFRFSNSSGWFALDRFLYLLGMEKVAMLRRITVVHPLFTHFPHSLSMEKKFWYGMLRCLQQNRISIPGCFYQKERWFDACEITPDPALVLEKTKALTQLRLLLPPTCDRIMKCPVDQDKFENLVVTFAAVEYSGSGTLPTAWANYAVTAWDVSGRSWAQETVLEGRDKKWRAEIIYMDGLGRYEGIGYGVDEGVVGRH